MAHGTGTVLTTVSAPYGVTVTAAQLAEKIVNPKSADEYDAVAFSFFSDVSPNLQKKFIKQMGVNADSAAKVANKFSKLAGFKLALSTE
ncbi:hypothetical protein [Roseovarius sp. SYSU LYC5161]|jgi:hypothetical protein|uniref:hypothetical protein n=1 Tax=Roseovarius halophilus (ex Wu et al. 2025) TaxID=3376060 RepID=UPI003999DC32